MLKLMQSPIKIKLKSKKKEKLYLNNNLFILKKIEFYIKIIFCPYIKKK